MRNSPQGSRIAGVSSNNFKDAAFVISNPQDKNIITSKRYSVPLNKLYSYRFPK